MKKLVLFALLVFAPSVFAQSQSSNTMNFNGVTPPAAPVLTALTPSSGYTNAAATVSVTGTGFAANCTATFNGAAVPFTFVSTTSGTLAVPAGKVVVGNNPIIVSCPLAVLALNSPVQLPNAHLGLPYTVDLTQLTSCTAFGGTCSFSPVTPLPTGLTLSASGIVTGTPSGAGSFSFDYTVTSTTVAAISRVHFITA